MGSFLCIHRAAEPEAAEGAEATEAASSEERRRNERKHSNNYRSERSIFKAIITCLVSIYNRTSQNQLKWKQMIALISGAIEFAYDNRFAANHPEAAGQVCESQRQRCIKTVEKTTRDNIAKIFNNFNHVRGYHSSDKLYVCMSGIGCAERTREDRIIILSLLMISAVNYTVLCSLTTREPHLQTMDQELNIANIFHLCVERLDHNTHETDVPMVPDSPRPGTSPAEDAPIATDDDDEVVGPRRKVFKLRVAQEIQIEPLSERSSDEHEASDMPEFAHLVRGNIDVEEDTFAQALEGLLQQQQQQPRRENTSQDEEEYEYESTYDDNDEDMPWRNFSD